MAKAPEDEDRNLIGEWQVSKRDLLRVEIRQFKGTTFVDLRRWYRDALGVLCPGKGVSVPPDIVRRLWKALRKAELKLGRGQ